VRRAPGRGRIGLLATALSVALLTAGCFSGSQAPAAVPAWSPATPAELVALVNESRASAGLPPMAVRVELVNLAEGWSAHMAATGTFGHRDLQAAIEQPEFDDFQQIGENIFAGWWWNTAQEIHGAWMNSPGHRDNILSGLYDTIGIGLVFGADGRLWVTQNFGKLHTAPPSPTTVPPTTPTTTTAPPTTTSEPPATTTSSPPSTPPE